MFVQFQIKKLKLTPEAICKPTFHILDYKTHEDKQIYFLVGLGREKNKIDQLSNAIYNNAKWEDKHSKKKPIVFL